MTRALCIRATSSPSPLPLNNWEELETRLVPNSHMTAPTFEVSIPSDQQPLTNELPARFLVTFSEPIVGFEESDVILSGSAGATQKSITEIAPMDKTRFLVTVPDAAQDGSITVSLTENAVEDLDGNPSSTELASATVRLDRVAPTVSITPTPAGFFSPDDVNQFLVEFSESVTGFTMSDIQVGGTAGASGLTQPDPSNPLLFEVTDVTRPGVVTLTIPEDALSDGAGNSAAEVSITVPVRLTQAGVPDILAVGGRLNSMIQRFEFTADGKLDPIDDVQAAVETGQFVRGAVGDFNGDQQLDVAVVAGPGGPSTLRLLGEGLNVTIEDVFGDPNFTGGLFVAAGDTDGDGVDEIYVTPDVGGGGRLTGFRFDGSSLVQTTNFFAINDPDFRGGARVAMGDVNADGAVDVIVGAGFGGGPRVAIFDGQKVRAAPGSIPGFDGGESLKFDNIADFFAFTGSDVQNLRNGVFLAAGDFNEDGREDLIFGGGPGGGPRVFVIDSARLTDLATAQDQPIVNFFAGDPDNRGGIRVSARDIDGDTIADLALGTGENAPARILTYLGADFPESGQGEPALNESFDLLAGTLEDGVFVG